MIDHRDGFAVYGIIKVFGISARGLDIAVRSTAYL